VVLSTHAPSRITDHDRSFTPVECFGLNSGARRSREYSAWGGALRKKYWVGLGPPAWRATLFRPLWYSERAAVFPDSIEGCEMLNVPFGVGRRPAANVCQRQRMYETILYLFIYSQRSRCATVSLIHIARTQWTDTIPNKLHVHNAQNRSTVHYYNLLL